MAEDTPQPQKPEKEKVTTYSLRPKGEMKKFIDELVKEKGSVAQALEHCVRLAMAGDGKPVPVPAPKPAPAPDPKPAPAPTHGGIVLMSGEITQLDKIQKSKKKSQREAITYSIEYTAKNAWL